MFYISFERFLGTFANILLGENLYQKWLKFVVCVWNMMPLYEVQEGDNHKKNVCFGGSRVLQLLHMQQSEFVEKIVIKLEF